MFPENEGCFSIGNPPFYSAAIYWGSPCLASMPRLGHHISRVCVSRGGYMKYRNSFWLFSSTIWRSDSFEYSDFYEVFTPKCEAPYPRQWTACLAFLLTYPQGNRTWDHTVIGRSQLGNKQLGSFRWVKQGPAIWHRGWRDESGVMAWGGLKFNHQSRHQLCDPCFDTRDLHPAEKSKRLTQSEVSSWVWRGFWGA